jgi:hypothetical protein
MRVAGTGSAVILALAGLVAFSGDVKAAASDVRVAGADCAATPEVVEVKNFGDQDQSLAGWKLLSDGDQPFDLTPAGTIPAGASIFIESGPGAQASLKWSTSQVLRDNDPADYARLVDDAGVSKGQVACAQATPVPTAAPTPTATPAAGQVPNGGGPPGAPDQLLSPVTLIYAGGSMLGALAGISVAWMGVGLGLEQRRKRRKDFEPEIDPEPPTASAPEAAQMIASPQVTALRDRPSVMREPLLMAIVVALVAAVLVALLLQSQDSRRK